MKAHELLEKQHRLVERLFERFENAKDKSEKTKLWEEIASNLVAHDAIEREIFYPACEREIDDEDVLRESLVEHGVVEFCLFRADKHKSTDKLDSYVKVLKEIVLHHVEEEEKDLLPKAKRELGDERLDALGRIMEMRFAKALASDFRKPLRQNLQEVLAGRTKTKPASPKPRSKPARKRTVSARRKKPTARARSSRQR